MGGGSHVVYLFIYSVVQSKFPPLPTSFFFCSQTAQATYEDGALCIWSMNHSQRKAGEEGLST